MKQRILSSLLPLCFTLSFDQACGEEAICTTGNFALPTLQQPGPLIGFGENILDRNQVQLLLFGDAFIGKKKHFVDLVPGILYGITDDFSAFLNVPIASSYHSEGHSSSGLEDLFLQLEYAFYTGQSGCSSDQAQSLLISPSLLDQVIKIPPREMEP